MSNRAGLVAIVGRTNVGKSSLFNAALGRREAIVAREAGTTRDRITARASYDGKDFWLVDTAGLKSPDDDFELTIQDQISEAAATADVIVVVVEANVVITADDRKVATMALKSKKPVLLAVNKIDKNSSSDTSEWLALGIKQILATSASQKRGIEELLAAISQNLPISHIGEDANRIRVALLGRPNVGKSSLFNSLGAKQQALVSEKAGTTRDINRVIIRYHNREIEMMDTAGIRRSGKIERGIEHFSVLRALSAIEQADIGLVLMDIAELNVQLDQKIADLVREAGKGLILVVTKYDTAGAQGLDRGRLGGQIAAHYPFVPWAPLIFSSALSGQNVTKIFDLLLEIAAARQQRIKTSELNQWLRRAVDYRPPVGIKNHSPKLNYMVQEDSFDLPSFKIFGSRVRSLHWSYRRFLEKQFRETWPFAGTPVKFWYIEKK